MKRDTHQIEWINSALKLEHFCESVGTVLAVDTESDHYLSYSPQICLVQAATPEHCALIDPFAFTKEELEPFFKLLGDAQVIKLFHAGQNDFIEFDRDFGVEVVHVFDTRIAARFLGYKKTSLDALLLEKLGLEPGPNLQKFDWRTRPLPADATGYAASDVVHLFELQSLLEEELEESSWGEPFKQTCAFVAATSRHEERPFDKEGWRRLKGSNQLRGRNRAILQELFIWRHELCCELNQAAFRVVPNHDLFGLASQPPATLEELKKNRRVRRLNSSVLKSLWEAIQSGKSEAAPPAKRRSVSSEGRATPEEEECVKRLKRWRNREADQLDLPSEFIATNDVLLKMARENPSTRAELEETGILLPWQYDLFGRRLLEIIQA